MASGLSRADGGVAGWVEVLANRAAGWHLTHLAVQCGLGWLFGPVPGTWVKVAVTEGAGGNLGGRAAPTGAVLVAERAVIGPGGVGGVLA